MVDKDGFFDHRATTWEEKNYPPDVRRRLEELIPAFGVRECERVLDIGTGPGILIPYLRERVGKAGRICALDLSFEMVRKAREKSRGAKGLILQADVHRLPFGENSQNRVICFAAFPHFRNLQAAMGEMGRVLVPGGVLVIAHLMSRRELAAHHGTHSSVARDLLPDSDGMKALFEGAQMSKPVVVDIPGRYLAVGVKRTGREPCGRFRSMSACQGA